MDYAVGIVEIFTSISFSRLNKAFRMMAIVDFFSSSDISPSTTVATVLTFMSDILNLEPLKLINWLISEFLGTYTFPEFVRKILI